MIISLLIHAAAWSARRAAAADLRKAMAAMDGGPAFTAEAALLQNAIESVEEAVALSHEVLGE